MSDYGSHCERLAGYGVGSGELREYEPFSSSEAETVEANTQRDRQVELRYQCPKCLRWLPQSDGKILPHGQLGSYCPTQDAWSGGLKSKHFPVPVLTNKEANSE